MDKYIFELRISRLRDTKDGLAFRMAQNNLFSGMVNFLVQAFKIDKSALTKDQLRDDMQSFQVEGTKEYCEEIKQKVEGLSHDDVQKFLDKPLGVRSLPAWIRRKTTELRYSMTESGFARLQNTLALFRISISCDVQRAK